MSYKMVKKVEQQEYIIVLENIIQVLYDNYRLILPKTITDNMLDFLNIIQQEREKNYDVDNNIDIDDIKIIEHITFEDIRINN